MDVLVGTSGYAYKEWKGRFYPEDLPATKFLAYYAGRLHTVEINNTFYRMPKRDVVKKWADTVPEGFSFVLKASQRITHKKRLKDCEDEVGFFTGNAQELGDKQGPLLFQLPPWLKKGTERLSEFLASLPDGLKAAFEFRHESWFDDEVYDALRGRDAALVISDTGKIEAPVVATAPYGYLRLRRESYSEADLDEWAARIEAQPWETAHVFFKHEDEATGPLMAEAFAKRFDGS